MRTLTTIIVLYLSISQLLAEDIAALDKEIISLDQEITILDEEVNELQKTVDSYSNIIISSSNNNILETLKKYDNPTAKLIEEWIRISSQIEDNDSINSFVLLSRYQIKSHLERLLFDKKNIIDMKDYHIIKNYINNITPTLEKLDKSLDKQYGTKKGLYLRSIPIISKMTLKKGKKKPLTVPKNYTFKLLYEITYNSLTGKKNHWGYISVNSNGKKGWINLKNTYRLK